MNIWFLCIMTLFVYGKISIFSISSQNFNYSLQKKKSSQFFFTFPSRSKIFSIHSKNISQFVFSLFFQSKIFSQFFFSFHFHSNIFSQFLAPFLIKKILGEGAFAAGHHQPPPLPVAEKFSDYFCFFYNIFKIK
jgi:hypothetical protein